MGHMQGTLSGICRAGHYWGRHAGYTVQGQRGESVGEKRKNVELKIQGKVASIGRCVETRVSKGRQ